MEVSVAFRTPVLFLIFNRPDCTARVLAQLREVKPVKLYVAADGPRSHINGERQKCIRTRNVLDNIDWQCEVKTLFRETNMGCKDAISSAISWFFDHEEEGIILEDDCVPDQTFFPFCEHLLELYRRDDRVMHIGGSNLNSHVNVASSYYFSNYNHVWGWASWRRAWMKYDKEVRDFPQFFVEKRIDNILGNRPIKYSWLYKFWQQFHGKIDTWDYQWTYSIWNNNGISITPAKNLVMNIGFNSDATHTKVKKRNAWELRTEQIRAISHPAEIKVNNEMDRRTDKVSYNSNYLKNLVFWMIMKSVRLKIIQQR